MGVPVSVFESLVHIVFASVNRGSLVLDDKPLALGVFATFALGMAPLGDRLHMLVGPTFQVLLQNLFVH